MPHPLPANTNFYIERKCLASNYAMQTLEASSEHYEIGYMISGDRLMITPTCSYTLHAGDVGTMPPFIYHKTVPFSNVPYDRYLIKFTPDFVSPLTDALGQNILNEVYSQLFNRFPASARHRVLLYFEEMLELYQSDSRYGSLRLQYIFCDFLLAVLENRLSGGTNDDAEGTTIEGVQTLEKAGLRASVMSAVEACVEKSKKL